MGWVCHDKEDYYSLVINKPMGLGQQACLFAGMLHHFYACMYVVVALFSLYAVVGLVYYIDWLQSFLYKPTGWTETKATTVLWDRVGLLSVSQTLFCSFC